MVHLKISIVIPFHKVTDNLSEMLNTLLTSKYENLIGEILLCHNGPHLKDLESAKKTAKAFNRVSVLHTDRPGLGNGCKIGIQKAQSSYVLITAIDLPFGLSDLDQWFFLSQTGLLPDVVIGSKMHPSTLITNRSALRKLSSWVFMTLKKFIIPINLPLDTQGTIFIETSFAKTANEVSNTEGFFFTTELVSVAIARGATFSEVPVNYPASEGKSSVSPIKDGIIFIECLIKLGQKLMEEVYARKK